MNNDKTHRKPLIATFLTCVLLGPPLGGLVVAASMLVGATDPAISGMFERVMLAALTSLIIMPFSYVSGGVPALVSGVAMVAYGWLKGQPPLWFAIGCSLASFAALQNYQAEQKTGSVLLLLVAHVIPAFICWLVFRRFWQASV